MSQARCIDPTAFARKLLEGGDSLAVGPVPIDKLRRRRAGLAGLVNAGPSWPCQGGRLCQTARTGFRETSTKTQNRPGVGVRRAGFVGVERLFFLL